MAVPELDGDVPVVTIIFPTEKLDPVAKEHDGPLPVPVDEHEVGAVPAYLMGGMDTKDSADPVVNPNVGAPE